MSLSPRGFTKKQCAGWCSLSAHGYQELWARAQRHREKCGGPAHLADVDSDDNADLRDLLPNLGHDGADEAAAAAAAPQASEHDQARRWLMGDTCAQRLMVWHAAHHFMLRCTLRICAELQQIAAQDASDGTAKDDDDGMNQVSLHSFDFDARRLDE